MSALPQVQVRPALQLGQDVPRVPGVKAHTQPPPQPPDGEVPVREAGAGSPPRLALHPDLEPRPEADLQVTPNLLRLK